MEIISTHSSSNPPAQNAKASVSTLSAPEIAASKSTETATESRSKTFENTQAAKLQKALSKLDIPEISNGNARVELNFNQDTGRVVAKITDRASGEVLRELPSKELQQLFSQMREYLGSIVDEKI